MRRLAMLAATLSATLGLSTGVAMAKARTLPVLITIQGRIRNGLDWEVLGRNGTVLGSATDVCNRQGTVCVLAFRLPHGSIRMTWDFAQTHRESVLRATQITGGSGQYAGARGYASVDALGPGGTLSRTLSGAQFIQVVFHLR
jgi:hypothetical protein